MLLPVAIRAQTANVVWFDFFSQRAVKERWTHLDDLVTHHDPHAEFDNEGVRLALVDLGYPPGIARSRTHKIKWPTDGEQFQNGLTTEAQRAQREEGRGQWAVGSGSFQFRVSTNHQQCRQGRRNAVP